MLKKMVWVIALGSVGFTAYSLMRGEPKEKKKLTRNRMAPSRIKVAVIEIADPINFKDSKANLVKAAKNADISGIILIINSGGGSVGSFTALHDHIKKVATMKPVVALICDIAGSCGYLIASAANYIIASRCSFIGAIGIMKTVNIQKNDKAHDGAASVESFTAGEFKTFGDSHNGPLSERTRQYYAQSVDRTYQCFLNMVAANRNLNVNNYKDWAEGKLFISPDALELGLIDSIGTIFEAEDKVLELIRKQDPSKYFESTVDTVDFNNLPTQTAFISSGLFNTGTLQLSSLFNKVDELLC